MTFTVRHGRAMALIEIVDLPNLKMGGFSMANCKRLPEGNIQLEN